MGIIIGNYNFEGPYTNTSYLEAKSGIYVILSLAQNGNYDVIDIGESAQVKTRIETHDRRECWEKHSYDRQLFVAVMYTPNEHQQGRVYIEQKLRQLYNPPCGKQ